jgi:hypothetical protein
MRLYSLALIWRLRRAVRRRVRKSKSLRRRTRWWNKSFRLERPVVYEPLLMIFLATIISGRYSEAGSAWLLTCLTVYCTATAVWRSRVLQSTMTVSPERILFHFYPLSDAQFFRWSLEGFLWKTVRVWIASGIVFAFVFGAHNEPWFWKAAAFATLEWLVTLAAIFALAAYVYGIPKWVPVSLYAATVFVFYAGPKPYITPAYPVLNSLPAGWLNLALAVFHARALDWIGLLVLTALAAIGVWTLMTRFRARIVTEAAPENVIDAPREAPPQRMGVLSEEAAFDELLGEKEADSDEEAADEEDAVAEHRPQTEWQKLRLNLVGSQVAKYTLSRDWLAPRQWSAESWLERLAAGWLNKQEKQTTEFLLGDVALRWSELWRASVIVAAVAGLLFAAGVASTLTLGMAAAALSALLGLPVLGGGWPATSPGRLSGKLSPLHGCYPLHYRTASTAMWKINLVRTAAWLPFGALLGALMGFGFSSGAGVGAWLVLKGIFVVAASTPLLSAGHFSKSTNDTTNIRLSTLPLFGFVVLVVLLFAVAAIMTMALPAAWSLVSLAASLTISLATWWLYGIYYERGQVDLLRESK